MRDFWWGGRDGGHDESGEWRPSPGSWSFTSGEFVGLRLRVYRATARGRAHWTAGYGLGARGWEASGTADSLASARRRAESAWWRGIAEAWRVAWSRVAQVYRWDADARAWEHVATTPGDWCLLDGYGFGVFALVRDGAPYYIQRWGYSSGGGSLPGGVDPWAAGASECAA